MSDNDWNWNKPAGAPPAEDEEQVALPKPGESWDTAHSPKPIHHVPENEWGTSPYDGSVNPQQPQPYGPPQPGPQQPGIQRDPQPPYAGPVPPHHAMTHKPPGSLTTPGSLDNNDVIALVLTFFFPGAGHLVLGQTAKGIAILIGFPIAAILTCGLLAIAYPVFLIDAYMVAQARKTRPVGDWEFFPK